MRHLSATRARFGPRSADRSEPGQTRREDDQAQLRQLARPAPSLVSGGQGRGGRGGARPHVQASRRHGGLIAVGAISAREFAMASVSIRKELSAKGGRYVATLEGVQGE